MPTPELTYEELEQLIKEAVQKRCPRRIKEFEKAKATLIQSARGRIERVVQYDPNADIKKLIGFVVDGWKKSKEVYSVYYKYCDLMKQQGLQPVSFDAFSRPNSGAPDLCKSFKNIRKDGHKVGGEVEGKGGAIFTIKEITRICRFVIVDENGHEINVPNLNAFKKVRDRNKQAAQNITSLPAEELAAD